MISPFHFHFRTYKRDLEILTKWWQQCIAWWELLNAACQIICIHKQHTRRYKVYSAGQTVPSTAQIRAEGNNTNVLERKDSMAVLPMGFGKSMCYVLPLFWTGSDHICKSSPMIHCGNRSFLEVTWQMFENGSEMAKS
jgi:hypothetical protein